MPANVRAAVDLLCADAPLSGGASRLSAAYRSNTGHAVSIPAADKRAYLAARLPATYAAVHRTLSRIAELGLSNFDSLLDAGCGPGTASLAAAEFWPGLSSVTRSDLDGAWRPIAEALGQASGSPALLHARWLTGAMDRREFPTHDAVAAAYALNEIAKPQRHATLEALWGAARRILILVEPGTPQGFLNIRDAREFLLLKGAHIAAPCTHSQACPMSEADWCHGAVRLARDAAHRAAKAARLPYEDEKFSYLAVTREPIKALPASRIVKRPMAQTGHIHVDICGPDGLDRITISRRDGATYKAARKAEWGDSWPG